MTKFNIGVIGSDGKISKKVEKMAELIGRDIAKNNCILICGGRSGVMEAACRGTKKENGTTVGILPVMNKKEANRYVDVILTTSLGYARNALVASCSDAVIAIRGGVGTLSEIAMALNYKKPVLVVKGSGGVADSIGSEFERDGEKVKIQSVKAEDAVKTALRMIK